MTVATQITLPEQPGTGLVKYIPLGGDGYRSPFALARWSLDSVGDASGGTNNISVFMPSEYCSVVAWIRAEQDDATLVAMQLQLRPDAQVGDGEFFLETDNLMSNGGGFLSEVTWVPPPVILVPSGSTTLPSIGLHKANVDTETLRLNGEAFLYDRRAYETGHAVDMLALVGRGGSRFTSL